MSNLPTLNQSAYEIAQNNRDVPGIMEAIAHLDQSEMTRHGNFSGSFKGYFRMMAESENKAIKDISADVLWFSFMNFFNEPADSKEAVNLFIGPVAEALILKMQNRNLSCLKSPDIARLDNTAREAAVKTKWLTDENQQIIRRLADATVQVWNDLFDEAKAQKIQPQGMQ